MNTSALTPPFSLIMNRIWPRDVTAEIRLMRYRAPVLDTIVNGRALLAVVAARACGRVLARAAGAAPKAYQECPAR
jgi:hypothetical protein